MRGRTLWALRTCLAGSTPLLGSFSQSSTQSLVLSSALLTRLPNYDWSRYYSSSPPDKDPLSILRVRVVFPTSTPPPPPSLAHNKQYHTIPPTNNIDTVPSRCRVPTSFGATQESIWIPSVPKIHPRIQKSVCCCWQCI